jgi:tetratricopeptide (TPR) repeat protein
MRGPSPFLLIAAAVLLSHAPVLTAGYVQDDHLVVERDRASPILEGSYWEGVEGGDRSLYRPVTVATYAAERALGGPRPAVSHAINLVLHASVAALLFALGRRFGLDARAALLGALLFALTPAKSEAVAGIVGRAEILAALFTLGATRLAWEGTRASAWGAAACVLLACGSKETGFVALPVIACAAMLSSPSWRTRFGVVLPSILAVEVALIARTAFLEAWLPVQMVPPMDNPLVALAGTRYAATALALATRAGSILAAPWGLAADYSGPSIAPEPGLLAWRPLLGAVLLIALAGLTAWGGARRRPAVVLGGLIAGASYLVTSNLLVPVGAIFAERFLYLPAAGLALVSAELLERLGRRARLVALGVALVYAALMLGRAVDWKSDATLFTATAANNPRSPRAALWLGVLAAEAGDHATARRELSRAAALWPDFAAPHLHLGLLEARGGDFVPAARAFETAIRLEPSWPAARLDLALALHRGGDPAGAERAARHATLLEPDNPRAWAELGHLRYERGALAEAIEPYRRAVALGRRDLALRLAECEASGGVR